MSRVVEIHGPTKRKSFVDVEIISRLIQHVLTSVTSMELTKCKPTLEKAGLMEKQVILLITKDARLWRLVARFALARKSFKEASEYHGKVFRCLSRRWEVGEVILWMQLYIEMVGAWEMWGGGICGQWGRKK